MTPDKSVMLFIGYSVFCMIIGAFLYWLMYHIWPRRERPKEITARDIRRMKKDKEDDT